MKLLKNRDLRRYKKKVKTILELENKYSKMSDEELKNMTEMLKNKINSGASLEDILPDAFATVRETSARVLGMRHFPVQLIGGIALHEGNIAQMKTGEGKTLVATLPAYLNALTNKGVHVITVNDYLAKRDRDQMAKIYEFLGLSVGVIVHDQSAKTRKEQYACDITYGTNNEFGFDYLKDNMIIRPEQAVQRELNYCIIDEVDSILIDEARTPLIISGEGEESTYLYNDADVFIRTLTMDDYETEEKDKAVSLTESGIAKAEKYFNIENITDINNTILYHHINQALKAHTIMKKDIDYVVKNDEIIIVDEFTGRLMFGRRYSDGLHQAIEAKEKITIKAESKTLATITFQNYFKLYEKLSGMTGTAKTEEEEFKTVYKTKVFVVPTNRPMIRKDHKDKVYIDQESKFNAVVDEIERKHKTKQPILVGTVSIDKSETLSKLLTDRYIPHQVLNAKNHEKEAEIIAQAGRLGAVTIATNMAGRGTDILLGGNPSFMALREMKRLQFTDEIINRINFKNDIEGYIENKDLDVARETYKKLVNDFKDFTDSEHEEVIKTGGLCIIGTERHESRRIDDQLRGRSGRQGDPGESIFYLALDDDLMRLFGSERIKNFANKMGIDKTKPIDAGMLTKSIENAQKKVEGKNFGIRKQVLEYDNIMNRQRNIIYTERRNIINNNIPDGQVYNLINKAVKKLYDKSFVTAGILDMVKFKNLIKHNIVDLKVIDNLDLTSESFEKVYDMLIAEYEHRRELLGLRADQIEKEILIQVIDKHWIDHIDAMDKLRQGIGLRGIGQVDPVVAYKTEGFEMFDKMNDSIVMEFVYNLFMI
jgi:preprotein translocase subunit SecA